MGGEGSRPRRSEGLSGQEATTGCLGAALDAAREGELRGGE